MDINYFFTFITGAGIIQGVFQALILFGIRKGNMRANRILAVLLLAFSVNITHSVLFADIIYKHNETLLSINEPFQFLLGPLIFFYVRQITNPRTRFKLPEILNFMPFTFYGAFIFLRHICRTAVFST